MRFHFLYHVPYEGPGSMESWILQHGHTLTATQLWNQPPFPEAHQFDFLVVMGGPMNIYEEKKFPWLKAEKRFIEASIVADKKVLGICLGSQLIADILGGSVTRNKEKEIGWMPIEWTDAAMTRSMFEAYPQKMTVLHWHGDTFAIPKSAVHLARSAACENQAFIYDDRVVGLQFHMEATEDLLQQFAQNGEEELKQSGPFIQSKQEILSNQYLADLKKTSDHLLDQMVKTYESSPRTSEVQVSQKL